MDNWEIFQGFQDHAVEWSFAGLWKTTNTTDAIESTAAWCYEMLGWELDGIDWFDSPKYGFYDISRANSEVADTCLKDICRFFLSFDVKIARKRARKTLWNEEPLLSYLDPDPASPWEPSRDFSPGWSKGRSMSSRWAVCSCLSPFLR